MTNELDFSDLTIVELPVLVADKTYTLREATEDAARQYQNALTKCTSFVGGEFSGIKGPVADTKSLLISLCLFREDGKKVSVDTVRGWPARVVKVLFDKAKEISELGEDEETVESLKKEAVEIQKRLEKLEKSDENPLGNEPDSTTDGSS